MSDEIERAIEDVLEGRPRAQAYAEMVGALEARRDTFARERDAAPDEAARKQWSLRAQEAERQLKVLREEQAIDHYPI